MNLTVIGVGYVGLVAGACFAEMGNTVYCVDIDEEKIDKLKQGIMPIYEPGLEDIVKSNLKDGRLKFTTSLPEAMKESNIYFIAVGTPSNGDGSANLEYVFNVASEIGQNLTEYSIIVDKSTVPVGTADKVRETIQKELKKRDKKVEFDVVSNPEFLKEGNAVEDFMKPDRIIVGTDSEKAEKTLQELYLPFSRHHDKFIGMGIRDAEMTKYTANAMLATKISFMNEIANICDRVAVDVENVRKGIGSDSRIGYSFIYPGAGYGGSCFPKDVKALRHIAKETGFEPLVLNAVDERNNIQKSVLFEKIVAKFGENLSGKTFGIWGLSFKPGTDDLREAPSKVLIKKLISAGAKIRAFDPVSAENAKLEFPEDWFENETLELVDNQYNVVKNVDGLILVTEWKQFREPDFDKIKSLVKKPIMFDGRNIYNRNIIKKHGFEYYGIGRG